MFYSCKDSANRAEKKASLVAFLFRGAAYPGRIKIVENHR